MNKRVLVMIFDCLTAAGVQDLSGYTQLSCKRLCVLCFLLLTDSIQVLSFAENHFKAQSHLYQVTTDGIICPEVLLIRLLFRLTHGSIPLLPSFIYLHHDRHLYFMCTAVLGTYPR